MNAIDLKEMFRRAEHWPKRDQDRLVDAARQIEEQLQNPIELDDADLKILSERQRAAAAGDFASDKALINLSAKFSRG